MDIQLIFRTWVNALIKPGEEFFAAERENSSANLSTALTWIIAASVIAALLGLLQAQMFSSALGGFGQFVGLLSPELQGTIGPMMETDMPGGTAFTLSVIIVGPIGFLIGVGIYHALASMLGGRRGQFGRYAYLSATFSAPLMIVGSLLNFVPVVGGCLSMILSIYQLALTYYATKVEYRLSQGRTIIVVAIPVLAALILFGCAMAAVFGQLFSTAVSSSGP